MIRIGILGNIGSGKSYIAKNFGFPVFNADLEVAKLYQKDKKIYKKLKSILPKIFKSFPIKKKEVLEAILADQNNLKKIIKIVHLEIKKKMNIFLNKNKNSQIVILDIPLLLENKINKKNDILIFVQASKKEILKRLKKRKNFNNQVFNKFQKIQFSASYKKRKSHFVILNDFSYKTIKIKIKKIRSQII